MEAVVAGRLEEGPHLGGIPGLHLAAAGAGGLGRVGGIDRVAEEAVPAHGVAEGAVQTGVDVVNGPGGEACLAVALALGCELGVEGVQVAPDTFSRRSEPMCGTM